MKAERHGAGERAYVSLGSNLGHSVQILQRALDRLQTFSDEPVRKSSLRQTVPVDCPPGSPHFINAAAGLVPRAGETPESLLLKLQEMERQFGREPKTILNEPRPLDLDLIAFGTQTRQTRTLVLPHPRAHLRIFVLQPLSEIAPDLVLPGQTKTVSELLSNLVTAEKARKLAG